MKKVISFSLWGDNPKYTIGAIKNAELVNKIYPSWVGRFYVGKSVPEKIINDLESTPNTEIILQDEDGDWTGMFWRFLACEDSDIMLSRDTDSRLSFREKLAVDEWLNSNKDFHIMRDHPWHSTHILGGMWGCRNGLLKGITNMIEEYKKGNFYQIDQNFLKQKIYPKINDNCMVHDSFFNFESFKKQFPKERVDKEFVGDVFDENDNRHPEHFKYIN